MKDLQHYNLKAHNTFGIDATCSRYIEFSSMDEAVEAAVILRSSGLPYIIIGGGSNLLLTHDFEGIVVRSAIKSIVFDDTLVRSGSGVAWDNLVEQCINHGLCGVENLSLIPGDVGASAVQNIGAYGAEVKDAIERIEAVEIATGHVCTFTNADCQYGYRDSRFKHEWKNKYLITHVTYRLKNFSLHVPPSTLNLSYGNIRTELEKRGISEPTPQQLRQVIIDIRNAKLPDPKVTGNAGSFFMNPVVSREKYEQLSTLYPDMPHYHVDDDHEKIPAGWMIDQCGWKGRSLGRAGVHDRQALVLVNLGGATGCEIVRLCQTIQHDVKAKFGIDIHPEVNIV